jgi:hypothetical protein
MTSGGFPSRESRGPAARCGWLGLAHSVLRYANKAKMANEGVNLDVIRAILWAVSVSLLG